MCEILLFFLAAVCVLCVCVCLEAVGGFVGEEQEMCFIQSEKNPSGVPRVCVPFVKNIKSRSQRL